jgi:hypothetical protein
MELIEPEFLITKREKFLHTNYYYSKMEEADILFRHDLFIWGRIITIPSAVILAGIWIFLTVGYISTILHKRFEINVYYAVKESKAQTSTMSQTTSSRNQLMVLQYFTVCVGFICAVINTTNRASIPVEMN